MLTRDEAEGLLQRVLDEFAPEWDPMGPVNEVTPRDPEHWLSGIGTFGVMLQHRRSGTVKVLGRRTGRVSASSVSYHRGISFVVLQAYSERNTDPVRRYLDEIGIARHSARPLSALRTA
ncbi:MAG TPA: hypothetical protein VID04_13435 [Methylomirabilota bacterium]|jgi:hypothetical protein